METRTNLGFRRYWIVLIMFFPITNNLFTQQIIKFKNGHGYEVNIIYRGKDTIKYQMISDTSVTLTVSTDQIESISPVVQDQNKVLRKHQKYVFKIDEGIGGRYGVKLISVSDTLIYFQERQDNAKVNIYLRYDKINEIIVSRKNHIGPYVGLATGFLGGCIYTNLTPHHAMSFGRYSTIYPNFWTVFAGAAAGVVVGSVIESIVKKRIKMKINYNHDNFLKYKPMLEEYLKK